MKTSIFNENEIHDALDGLTIIKRERVVEPTICNAEVRATFDIELNTRFKAPIYEKNSGFVDDWETLARAKNQDKIDFEWHDKFEMPDNGYDILVRTSDGGYRVIERFHVSLDKIKEGETWQYINKNSYITKVNHSEYEC